MAAHKKEQASLKAVQPATVKVKTKTVVAVHKKKQASLNVVQHLKQKNLTLQKSTDKINKAIAKDKAQIAKIM